MVSAVELTDSLGVSEECGTVDLEGFRVPRHQPRVLLHRRGGGRRRRVALVFGVRQFGFVAVAIGVIRSARGIIRGARGVLRGERGMRGVRGVRVVRGVRGSGVVLLVRLRLRRGHMPRWDRRRVVRRKADQEADATGAASAERPRERGLQGLLEAHAQALAALRATDHHRARRRPCGRRRGGARLALARCGGRGHICRSSVMSGCWRRDGWRR